MTAFKTQPPVMMCGMNVAGINEVDQRGRWHLSYNPSVQGYGCVTTALVLDNRLFFVLNGDHRKAWGEAADNGGINGAYDYFMACHQQINRTSEHRMALGLAHDEFSLMPTLKDCTTGPQFQMMYDFFKRKNHESN